MTAPELKPCPFCGCTTITQHMTHGIVFHACDWCGAEGPAEQTDDDQLPTGWNTRADLAPALAVPEVAEWQPIETAPKDGRDMLLWHKQFGIMMGHWDVATSDWWAIYAWPQPMREHPCETWFSPFMESDGEVGVDVSWWAPFPDTAALRGEGRG